MTEIKRKGSRSTKEIPKEILEQLNSGQTYKIKGDKENAIKYYELTEKYGDEQAKYQANQTFNN